MAATQPIHDLYANDEARSSLAAEAATYDRIDTELFDVRERATAAKARAAQLTVALVEVTDDIQRTALQEERRQLAAALSDAPGAIAELTARRTLAHLRLLRGQRDQAAAAVVELEATLAPSRERQQMIRTEQRLLEEAQRQTHRQHPSVRNSSIPVLAAHNTEEARAARQAIDDDFMQHMTALNVEARQIEQDSAATVKLLNRASECVTVAYLRANMYTTNPNRNNTTVLRFLDEPQRWSYEARRIGDEAAAAANAELNGSYRSLTARF